MEGTAVDCGNIICCRLSAGFPNDKDNEAGPYGNYYCDIPPKLLHSMGDFIKSEIKPDTIFWTGDVPPHDQWKYSLEYQQTYQKYFNDYMEANFSEYAVHVLEGNHDFVVMNS